MFYDALAAEVASLKPKEVHRRDHIMRALNLALFNGQLTDDQFQGLAELVMPRRQAVSIGQTAAMKRYLISRSAEQRSPDRRASLLRRRQHAATGPLPSNLAANFTTGELAALKIVADECLAHGACDLSRNEIGSRAGVSLTVVKRALHLAEVGLSMISVLRRPRSGRKHLTNIIRIIRSEWLTWLDKGNRKAYAIKACERVKPTFAPARGAQKDPPRAQISKEANSERVDKTVEKRNRTVASRDRL